MKVKCINIGTINGCDINVSELNLDKEYEVLNVSEEYYYIKNNKGYEVGYFKERFEVIEDTKTPTNPTHYQTKIQPIEYIEANNLGFHEGNVIKYITRYKDKNGIEDLEKAKTYIEMLINKLKREQK